MKSTKSLLASLILIASAFTGCQQDELIQPGIDQSKPVPEEFSYDEINSSESALAVYWNAEKAIKANVQSFTVQLLTDSNNGDNYDDEKSKTVKITDDVYDATIFSGTNIKTYDQYYVRIRANYRNSVYSDWVYLTLNGNPVKCEVGFGYFSEEYPTVNEYEYDDVYSSSTKMTFGYNAADASAKNADIVRIQLLSTSTGKVSYEQELTNLPSGVAEFDNLKSASRYKVRARAEYPNPIAGQPKIASPWVNLKGMAVAEGETEPQETDVFQAGVGAVVYTEPPTAKLVYASSSTLTFSWSTCAFTDKAIDLGRPYNVQLYRDKDCKDLVVSWLLSANNANYDNKQPSFLFSGLEQDTAYYFVVTDQKIGSSEPLEAKTTAFEVVTISETPASEGAYILAEDFSELVWGGDMLYGGVAYSANNRSSATSFDKAEGENPIGKGSDYYLVKASTEIGLFNTLGKAVPSTRLVNWGAINEGSANSYACARPGYLKLGASSYTVDLATPVLSSLAQTATVEISFDAARYSKDDCTMALKIVQSATEAGSNVLTNPVTEIVQEFVLDEKNEWKNYSFQIPNVEPTSRLAIGVKRVGTTAGSDQHRFFLDNIKIKVVAYGSSNVTLEAPILETTTKAESIILSWNEVSKAESYTVEYKEATAEEWIVVEGITETTYTIEGLLPKTAYSVRVKAVAGESESEYATPTNVTTGVKTGAFPVTVNNANEFVALFAGTDLLSASEADEVILGADIDLAGKTVNAAAEFAGIFNGNGKTIKNWNTSTPLFENLTGTVKDLVIDATCVATPAGNVFGFIAANSEGTIENVTNNGNATITLAAASEQALALGGLVGVSTGEIKGCTNRGKLTIDAATVGLSSTFIGGIAAIQKGTTQNSENYGALSVSALTFKTMVELAGIKAPIMAGGIAAMAKAEVKNCNNSGNITYNITAIEAIEAQSGLNRPQIAGIVGAPDGDITNCTNNGNINVVCTTADRSPAPYNYILGVGGISGGDQYATNQGNTNIIECTNNGNITVDADVAKSNATVGGIVAWPGAENTSVTNETRDCKNTGNIYVSGKMKGRIGGITGGTGHVVNCTNEGNVTADNIDAASAIGLLLGNHSQRQKLENCSVKGTLTVTGKNTGGVAALIGNQGNANQVTEVGSKIDAVINAPDAKAAMIVGTINTLKNKFYLGTEASPIKVKGTINGTVITADNLQDYRVTTVSLGNGGEWDIIAVYGE